MHTEENEWPGIRLNVGFMNFQFLLPLTSIIPLYQIGIILLSLV